MRESRRSRAQNWSKPHEERRRGDAVLISGALARRGCIALRVHGTSMLPWVRPGDVALIRKADADTIRFGDVTLSLQGEHLLVHRIVGKTSGPDGKRFFTKGDALPNADTSIGQEQLLGKVVRILRSRKRIDMNAPGQRALSLVIAKLSPASRFWFPFASLLAAATRPMRRLITRMT